MLVKHMSLTWPGSRIPGLSLFPALALCLCLLAAACAPAPRPAPPAAKPVTEARDLMGIKQDVNVFLAPQTLDAVLIAPARQEAFAARFRKAHYGPWARTMAAYPRQEALWGLGMLARNRHYGENLRLLGPEFRAEMETLAQAERYPNAALPAIATANTSLRVVPSNRPGFLKPTQPGEGFPFDYWQNSGIWAGTPLFVTQLSADGGWALVETRFAGGWVQMKDLAFVDEEFMVRWTSLPLLALTREHVGVTGKAENTTLQLSVPSLAPAITSATITPNNQANNQAESLANAEGTAPQALPPAQLTAQYNATLPQPFLFQGRIGTVLPLAGEDEAGYVALAPVRGPDGRAVISQVHIAKTDAAPVPLAPTPRNFALLANQMMGQPYGWGGYLENRDCSALLLDLYTPFGIFMPRNSRQQAKAGEVRSLAKLPSATKERQLLEQGAPLLTLVHKPGHIMLYIGEGSGQFAGRALILHAAWGLKTLDEWGAEGRFVIGRTAITTLEPGRELPEVARVGTLLDGIDSMTLVVPAENGGGQPKGNGQANGQGSGQGTVQ